MDHWGVKTASQSIGHLARYLGESFPLGLQVCDYFVIESWGGGLTGLSRGSSDPCCLLAVIPPPLFGLLAAVGVTPPPSIYRTNICRMVARKEGKPDSLVKKYVV